MSCTSSSSPTVSSVNLSDLSLDNGEMLAELTSKHIVQPKFFSSNPSAVAPLSTRDDMVNMESVYELLNRIVAKPLANSVVAPCRSAALALTGPAQSGARTAVEVWCATNTPRVNVIVYKWSAAEECDRQFFSKLMAVSAANSPCILVIHRITERAPPQLVGPTFVALWQAYLRYSEEKVMNTPPFWLMFIDRWAPSQSLHDWSCIRNRVALPEFDNAAAFLQSMIQQELRRLMGTDEEQVAALVAFYQTIADEIVRDNSNAFQRPRDVVDYINHLFDLPSARRSVAEIRSLPLSVSVAQVLPQPGDFDTAMVKLRETKRDVQAEHDQRVQAEEDARKRQHSERVRQLTSVRGY